MFNDGAATLTPTISVTGPFAPSPTTCGDIAPGDHCAITVVPTATALGALTGSLVVMANGTQQTAALTGALDAYVEATVTGAGQGAISYQPSVPCGNGGTCVADGTAVTITVAAHAGSHFVGWSDPACGSGLTCTVTAGATPHMLTGEVEVNARTFTVTFAGTGGGEVAVLQDFNVVTVCTASCAVSVDPGTEIDVDAATPDDFAGFMSTGTDAVTATFNALPGEMDMVVPGGVLSVDFDANGDLAVGTSNNVAFYDPSLALRWTAAPGGVARFTPTGDIIVVNTAQITKLDASGAMLWTHTGGLSSDQLGDVNNGRQFAVTASGGVVVNRNGSIDILDADGTLIAQPAASTATTFCVGAGPDGTIYVGVPDPDPDEGDERIRVETFSAAGVLDPDVFPPDFGLSDESICGLATSTSQLFVEEKGELGDWVGYTRFGFDRSIQGGQQQNLTNVLDPPEHAFAVNAAGEVGLIYQIDSASFLTGLGLTKYSASDAVQYTVMRQPVSHGARSDTGANIIDVAVAPDGRVAVAIQYIGFGFNAGATPSVEVFP